MGGAHGGTEGGPAGGPGCFTSIAAFAQSARRSLNSCGSLCSLTLPAASREAEALSWQRLAEDATSRLAGRNLPGSLSWPLSRLQKGKLRPKGGAWVKSQSWTTPALPGPWSGPALRELGCFAQPQQRQAAASGERAQGSHRPGCRQPGADPVGGPHGSPGRGGRHGRAWRNQPLFKRTWGPGRQPERPGLELAHGNSGGWGRTCRQVPGLAEQRPHPPVTPAGPASSCHLGPALNWGSLCGTPVCSPSRKPRLPRHVQEQS